MNCMAANTELLKRSGSESVTVEINEIVKHCCSTESNQFENII